MKRISAHFVVTLALLALSACSPDPSSKEQADASAAFAGAQKLIEQVASGYIDPGLLKVPAADSMTLRDYQRQLLQQAIEQLAPLTSTGSDGQRVAAALSLADAHATLARFDAQDAVKASNAFPPLSDRVIATLVAARSGQTLADASGEIDNSASVDTARRALSAAQTESERISLDIGKLSKEIETLDAKIADLSAKRDAATKESSDLRTRAFQATGELRFDLYSKSGKLAVAADQLSGQIDLLNVDRSKLDEQRSVATIAKQLADSRAQAAQRAIDELATHNKSVAAAGKLGTETAATSADDLLTQMKAMSKNYDENVVARFDSARGHLEQAVKTLSAVLGKDPARTGDVKLQYAARQAELGHLLRQASVLYKAHANLLNLVATQGSKNFPAKQGQELTALFTAASAKAKQAADDALAALTTADEYLAQAIDSVRTPEATQAALRQQEMVCVAGGELGDQKLGGKVSEIRSKIKG